MYRIRTVLNLLHLKQNPRRRVHWLVLREEPLVYLNVSTLIELLLNWLYVPPLTSVPLLCPLTVSSIC
jgi:hypothetical protein